MRNDPNTMHIGEMKREDTVCPHRSIGYLFQLDGIPLSEMILLIWFVHA